MSNDRIGSTPLTITAGAAAALAASVFTAQAAYAQSMQEPARHPYTATCSVDGDYPPIPGRTDLACILSPAPPPNAETVIQSVDVSLNSFELSNGPTTPLWAWLAGYSAHTSPAAVTYVPFTPAPGTTATWVAHELTAIYVDPNRPVQCSAVELNLHPDAILMCTVSGYFIPAQ